MAISTRKTPTQKEIPQPFLSRYEVLSQLGEGGVATVFKVLDHKEGSIKALKALKPSQGKVSRAVERFEEEYRILRSLHHPSLPEVYDYGFTAEGTQYIVMEFVEGVALDEYVKSHRGELWLLLYQLCEALAFIHEHGLLHLDLKPGNVLVRRTKAYGSGDKPLITLLDFGLSYRRGGETKASIVGTPGYMAPEIIRGEEKLTRAADYYSLGATIYELIEGKLPFEGSVDDVLRAHLTKPIAFSSERVEYTDLYPQIEALLSKNPTDRLEVFGDFWRSMAARVGGEIAGVERAYAMGYVESLGIIGKGEVWERLRKWVGDIHSALYREAPDGAEAEDDALRYLLQRVSQDPRKTDVLAKTPGPRRKQGAQAEETKGGIAKGSSEGPSKDQWKTEILTDAVKGHTIERDILASAGTEARPQPKIPASGLIQDQPRIMAIVGARGSGKSFIVDALKGECQTRRVGVRVLGQGGDYEELVAEGTRMQATAGRSAARRSDSKVQSTPRKTRTSSSLYQVDPRSIIIDRFVRGWERLVSKGEKSGMVLVMDGFQRSSKEEKEFLDYVLKRIELALDEGKEPGVVIVVTGKSPGLKRELAKDVPKGQVIDELVIGPPGAEEVESVLKNFRGNLAGLDDRKRLEEYLREHQESTAAMAGAVKEAIIRGELRREGGRWQFIWRAATTRRKKETLGDYYELLLSRLEGKAKELVIWLSCHRPALDIESIASLTGLTRWEIGESVDEMRYYRIVDFVKDKAGSRLGIISEAVREAFYNGIDESVRKKIHKKYLDHFQNRLDTLEGLAGTGAPKPSKGAAADSTSLDEKAAAAEIVDLASLSRETQTLYEIMSYHYERVGEFRQALLMLVKALRLLKQTGDVYGIRSLCRRAIELIAGLRGKSWTGRKWHLERFFIKRLIDAEWLVHNYRGLCDIITHYITRKKRPLPISFAYKYATALRYSGNYAECAKLIESVRNRIRYMYSESYMLISLVEASMLNNMGSYENSLKILTQIKRHERVLSPSSLCKVYVYFVLNYYSLGLNTQYLTYFNRSQALMRKYRYYDDLLSIYNSKIIALLNNSLYSKARSELKEYIRLANKLRIYSRLCELYFLLSAIYYEEGNYKQTIKYLSQSIKLATNIGMNKWINSCRIRHSLIYQNMGLYATALEYAELVKRKSFRKGWTDDYFYSLLQLLAIHGVLNSRKSEYYMKICDRVANSIESKPDIAHYRFHRGSYHYKIFDYETAYRDFEEAKRLYEEVGYDDDAARSAVRLAQIAIETQDYSSANVLMNYANRKLRRMESSNLLGEFYLLKLSYYYFRRHDSRMLKYYLLLCEDFRPKISDVNVVMQLDTLLFQAHARLGDAKRGIKFFNNYYNRMKRIVSNLDNKSLIDSLIKSRTFVNNVSDFKLLKRQSAKLPKRPRDLAAVEDAAAEGD